MHWNEGKRSPASSISEYEPCLDMMGRGPCVSPTGGGGEWGGGGSGGDGMGLHGGGTGEREGEGGEVVGGCKSGG